MKKWLTLCTVCLCQWVFALPLQDHHIDPTELLDFFGIPQDAYIAETQQHWLRKPRQERWEMTELSTDEREFVLRWARKQGLFSPWKPIDTTYDKALILGATTSRMPMRLDFLKQLWNEGTRFDEIVWLTGDRPLDPRVDDLTEKCQNESEAARILWEKADLPEAMRNLPVVFVAVPMKIDGNRPTTRDTILAWLDISPTPCQALFVSDQPFCGYQFAIIKANLPDPFLFDLVGPGVDSINHPAAAAIILDSVARWIYQDIFITQKEQQK